MRAFASRKEALTLALSQRERGRRHVNRRGQALVEFAIVSLVVYMLLAAILTFGQLLYYDQTLQQAADVGAREISRTPLPAAVASDGITPISLNYVLYHDASTDSSLQDVRRRVFDDNMLVLKIDAGSDPVTFNGGHPIGDFPLATQQLLPVMIYDTVNGGPLLRFPGAPSTHSGTSTSPAGIPYSGYVVRIPVVSAPMASGGGQTIINWLHPIEAILDSNGVDAVCRECDPRLRPQRNGRLADQLSVSVGKHERFCAAGSSGVAVRSNGHSRACRRQHPFVRFAFRCWRFCCD